MSGDQEARTTGQAAQQSEQPILRATIEVHPDRIDTRLSFGLGVKHEHGAKAVEQALASLQAEFDGRHGCPANPVGRATCGYIECAALGKSSCEDCRETPPRAVQGAGAECTLSSRKEVSGQNVSLSPLRGQIANTEATGVDGEMVAREANAVFDPARTSSDPYDDRPGPWYDMKRVREIEAATGISFASVHPELVLGRSTDELVEGFSAALKSKLRAAEAKYGWQNGWLKTNWQVECQQGLLRHVGKGDPLDVAAYAAFCWHHGWPTASQRSTDFVTGAVIPTSGAIAAYTTRYPQCSLSETSDSAIECWNHVAAAAYQAERGTGQGADGRSSPADLRAHGLTVAIHNDYRLGGKAMTFWLMTRETGGRDASGRPVVRAFKGEGETDAEALDKIRAELGLPLPFADSSRVEYRP